MNCALIITALVSIAFAEINVKDDWNQFKSIHNKQYSNSIEERLRYNIFQDNLRKIQQHNEQFDKGLVSYKMGVTKFADMTQQEFIDMLTYSQVNKPNQWKGEKFVLPPDSDMPDAINWKEKGAVTEIKDQGSCGSCWSFSATASLEGQNFLKTKKLVSLSEQNLVDCSGSFGDMGCLGGLMDYAFDYIIAYGIMTEDAYPYTGVDGTCKYSDDESVVHMKRYVDIERGNEKDLQAAVANIGPVSIAVDAYPFQLYDSGILNSTSCSTTSLNHGVTAVGYGMSDEGVPYWLVKNSWGRDWGEDGYIRVIRGCNMCGVATEASYPLV